MRWEAGGSGPKWRAAAACGAALVAVLACDSEPEPPDAQVRRLIARAEAAAERRDKSELLALVSHRYADDRGNDRAAIGALLSYTFLRNRDVHLLVRTRALELPEPGRAEVSLLVAMANVPIPGLGDLEALRADLHRFDLSLLREEDPEGADWTSWRVTRAAWRRATAGDVPLVP